MKNAPVREGEVLAGKYRVERVLGAGGMGVVVAAHHLQLDERVALKFLLPEAMESGEVVARFAREARAAAKIKSEHVARVTDVGVLESGAPYLVMEFLHGLDLAALLAQRGPLPVAEVAEYVLQASEAVAEAHSLGIVHRDLKPGNLFVTRRHDGSPCVKVLDFGISKMRGGAGMEDPSMTATNTAIGSPLYMSPEQMVSAKTVDQRSDVWSLGIILYELLSGRPPFTGATFAELVLNVAQQPMPSLRALRPDLPEALEQVVLRCLEKDPARRVRHVGELAALLAPFGALGARISLERISRMMGDSATVVSGPSSVGPSSAVPVDARSGGAATAGAWGKTSAGATPKGKRALGAALVVVAGVAIAGGWMGFRQAQPSPPSSAGLAETTTAPAPSAETPLVAVPTAPPTVLPVPAPVAVPSAVPAPSAERASPTKPTKAGTRAHPGATDRRAATATATATATPAPTPAPAKLDFGGRN